MPRPLHVFFRNRLDHQGALPVHLPGEREGGQTAAHQCIRCMAAHTGREEGGDRSDHSNAAQCQPLVSGKAFAVDGEGEGPNTQCMCTYVHATCGQPVVYS